MSMRLRNSIVLCSILTFAIPVFSVLAVMHVGCKTNKATMTSGAGVPASEGTVQVSTGPNDNTKIIIRVRRLAPPSKVVPDATVYVVWIKPRNGAVQNVGSMILNKNLEGFLNTTTPHRRFKVIVTPEPSGKVNEPTHEPVFTSEVERAK